MIRQHTLTDVSLADLADGGLMPFEVAEFLDAAILARKSMVISGDQGAGKTTLLRALINSIPLNERFGTLETDYELMTHLQPGRENILALQARVGHGEMSGGSRVGEFTHLRAGARSLAAEPLSAGRRRGSRRRGGRDVRGDAGGHGHSEYDPFPLGGIDYGSARVASCPRRRA